MTSRHQEARQLESRIRQQQELLSHYKAEGKRIRDGVRYRLGDAFVRAATSPMDLLKLPVRIFRLLFEGFERRRRRSRGEDGIGEYGIPVIDDAPPESLANRLKGHELQPVYAPEQPPRYELKVAAIMDTFTFECFRPECRLISLRLDDWKETLEAERPDFLFVESAWKGNDGAWTSQIARAHLLKRCPLVDLVDWCREQKIPTVFWNKEDPPNFDHFIFAASHFDHIFTTDEDCIPRYKEKVRHDSVHALPFAAQVDIHNPVGSHGEKYSNSCFAGTYYAKRHASRRADVKMLLEPALARGLQIFDRMHDFAMNDDYDFPEKYKGCILGSLPYPEMVNAYKKYRIFLNVNSVKDSPTMFSRRVFEILACGTPIISTYSLGIERLLGPDCVALVKTEAEAEIWIDRLIADENLRDRMVLLAQRRIFSEHTYTHRIRQIAETLSLQLPPLSRKVSIVTCTNRPSNLENCIANYERQSWPDKELVLVLNSDEFQIEDVRKRLQSVPDARVFQLPESASLGECLNRGFDECRFDYLTKCDDDNYHAEHFLTDLMHAFLYTGADIVGKCSYYTYLEGTKRLALRFSGEEHKFVTFLSGSAMIFRRHVFEVLRFPEESLGEDTQFLTGCNEQGFKMYSADRFNYIVRRAQSMDEHTWKIEEDEYMKACRAIAYFDEDASSVSTNGSGPQRRDGLPLLGGDPREHVTL